MFLFQWFQLLAAYGPSTVGQRIASPSLSFTCNGGVFVLFPVLFSKKQLLLVRPLGQQHLPNSSKCRSWATRLCRAEEGWQELTPHLHSQWALVPVSWQSIGCHARGADKSPWHAVVWQGSRPTLLGAGAGQCFLHCPSRAGESADFPT